MRNLKYTRKLLGEEDVLTEYNPNLPDNWHQVMDIVNTEKRRLARDLTWEEAEQALRREGISDVTQSLLVLKSMRVVQPRKSK